MKRISHRGNLDGPDREFENTPEYALRALGKGYDVELDVWLKNGHIYLGHDGPVERVKGGHELWQHKARLFLHAKNIDALDAFLTWGFNVFWNDKDDYALTSYGQIWTNYNRPGNHLTVYMLEKGAPIPDVCYGICSDYIERYK